ncbi:hypothetical protein EDF36_0827 [Rathayibacter sp. PhB152]|uniref:glycosyltransferase family 4 protein n=1 Tax=Rathayibacter sp. PhB152 TaxID=2485190 RepID=UPI000F9C8754|nr:glycosyltransferase family 4 protein [Rathayibacter sp. PhB152]ROQ63877.1 hypothetical protein EDF36_0827 [Rathayibacter sp. PhB152]
MKVLFCHPGSELYGSDRMAAATVKALADAGHVVTVVLPEIGPLEGLLTSSGADGVHTLDLPVLRKALLKPVPFTRLVLSLPLTIARCIRALRRTQADLVIANTITQPWWILAARALGLPSVVHVREAETEIPVIAQRVLLAPLALADRAVANSRATQEHVVLRGLRMEGKTSVVYNGKNWDPYFRSSFAGVSSRPHLVLVGRLNPRKGPDVAIRGLSALVARGHDASLTLVGSIFPGYEWYWAELHTLVSALGLEDRVVFAGFQEDTTGYLERADIVLAPSRSEPFGTIAAEGMAAERPVVVSNVQGLVEIVNGPSVGRVFNSEDFGALAEICEELIASPEEAVRMAREGRATVLERFSEHRYEREMVAIVEDTRAGRRARHMRGTQR